MNIKEEAHKMKLDSAYMAATTLEQRNHALEQIAQSLELHKEEIFAANHEDIATATEAGVAPAVLKRLKFDEGKLHDVLNGIRQLVSLADPLGTTQLARELDEGLKLYRISCPIGVIGVIFEARPDALVQISSLCIKSGNCALLKGGKETARTNRILFQLIHKSAVAAGMPENCMLQAELHNEISELLSCHEDVDLLIPRGSNQFVQYIMDNTKIPVMGHADGVCHIYVDSEYDMEKAIPVILDAKTQYTAACNTVETILVNRSIAKDFLPVLAKVLTEAGVKIRGTKEAAAIICSGGSDAYNVSGSMASGIPSGAPDSTAPGILSCAPGGTVSGIPSSTSDNTASGIPSCEIMKDEEFHTEYVDLILSVKIVEDVKEAVAHINRYGSHHTDCILTENDQTAAFFMQMVDSAGVYQNCSTRFADGFRYGFGAEVGISTGKIHARGPVGLEGLVTYKYKLFGKGQIVGDYASGKREFHFRDL